MDFVDLLVPLRIMGGPCRIKQKEDSSWKTGPTCTDNFQQVSFQFKEKEYQSCEQAYQAHKYRVGSETHEKISCMAPFAWENDVAYGTRCWKAGQLGNSSDSRDDWNTVKVRIMYEVNLAKYQQHPEMVKDLCTTDSWYITGALSTGWTVAGESYTWSDWNGLIQMRIREELRAREDRAYTSSVLEGLITKFEKYELSTAHDGQV